MCNEGGLQANVEIPDGHFCVQRLLLHVQMHATFCQSFTHLTLCQSTACRRGDAWPSCTC